MMQSDKHLKILILRTLDLSQEDVAGLVHCAKQTVGEVERWFKRSPAGEVSALLDDQRIRRLVDRDFPDMGLADADRTRAEQITADDILLHYGKAGRTDAPGAQRTVDPVYVQRLEEHWAKLQQVATRLREQLSVPPARVLCSAEVCQMVHAAAASDTPLTQGDQWRRVFDAPVEIRSTAGGGEAAVAARLAIQSEFLFPYLMSHLRPEFPAFASLDEWQSRLGALSGSCLERVRDVTLSCSQGAGLPYMRAGATQWLSYQFPAYVCQFALERPGVEQAPELVTETEADGSWRLKPRDYPAITLAGGTVGADTPCRDAFAREIARNAGIATWHDIATEHTALEGDAAALRHLLSIVIERGDFSGTCALCEGYASRPAGA